MLYNTPVFLGPDGRLLGRHRKLLPSNREKLFWHRGDGSDIKAVCETDLGRIGADLLRASQAAAGVRARGPGERGPLRLLVRLAQLEGGAHQRPRRPPCIPRLRPGGGCFVVISAMYAPDEYGRERSGFGNAGPAFFGGSGIVSPSGEYLPGPLYYDEDGIIRAEIDLGDIVMQIALHRPVGRRSIR